MDGPDFGVAEELYLTVVPEGRTVLLKGTARLIWLVAIEGGDVASEVARLVGRPSADIAEAVGTFLQDLSGAGLLANPTEAPSPQLPCRHSGWELSGERKTP
ncbi:hypothetical protein [Propioniciclava tarda]|uniref:PqqD family protein n=1 Tax=Propioniciclava tarda TaxID=433330 RepID=A0A4Q9KMI2_PROTD|nr:hypothetical protein [Propioniciclava tarda]TBT95738.1 hypothetical protein ET996_04670 [Propioniciclava tarda]